MNELLGLRFLLLMLAVPAAVVIVAQHAFRRGFRAGQVTEMDKGQERMRAHWRDSGGGGG